MADVIEIMRKILYILNFLIMYSIFYRLALNVLISVFLQLIISMKSFPKAAV